jgi:hypothetical protein
VVREALSLNAVWLAFQAALPRVIPKMLGIPTYRQAPVSPAGSCGAFPKARIHVRRGTREYRFILAQSSEKLEVPDAGACDLRGIDHLIPWNGRQSISFSKHRKIL